VDDLKLLGRSEKDLGNEIKTAKAISKDVNMNFGLQNCVKICFKKGREHSKHTEGTHLRWTLKSWT
jgi:hypothetical protein